MLDYVVAVAAVKKEPLELKLFDHIVLAISSVFFLSLGVIGIFS